MEERKVIFSAIQPSGVPTLGNYLGALRNWVSMAQEHSAYYGIANLHAITVRQEAAALRGHTLELAAMILACGIDPEQSTLFIQSDVPEHSLLAWTLNCSTYMGELSRMTQFKDKSARHAENINVGLFTYPVLQAADILLYGAHYVPVGEDQRQHVELTRDIAMRFNNAYGETFVLPDLAIPKVGARIMNLQEPTKKMSKSDENPNAFILLSDDADTVVRKLKRAVTDSEGVVAYDPINRAGISNLLSIYGACTGKTVEQAAQNFAGQGYGGVKQGVADAVVATLAPIQSEYSRLMKDKAYLAGTLRQGAEKASYTGSRTLKKVYRKLGLEMKY